MAGRWETCEFQDLFAIPLRNGLTRPKSVRGNGTKMVNMREIFSFSRIQNQPMDRVALSKEEADKYLLHTGDLLFARQSLVASGAGKCSIVMDAPEPRTFESHLIRARLDPKKADPLFYYYFFSSPAGRKTIGSIVEQVAAAGIRGSDLARLRVPLPPMHEQRAIAHILGTLDDKIELNRRMNETLEAMARAIFKAWFVEFEPVRAKMEGRWHRGESLPGLPAHLYDLFPDRLADSELGEIPEGWEVMSFADTVEVIGGGTPKTSVPEYWNGDIPWFSVTDAPRDVDVWVVNTEKKITRAGVENSSTRILTEGITILSARGTVGRVALVGVPMAMNQSCYGLRGKTDERGFYTYFATRALVSDLKQRTHGSVFDTVTRDTLKSVIVLSPPGDLVQAFERSVTPVLERIRRNLLANRTLAELRDALLPKVVSGEIRVKDAEWFLRDVEVVHDG